ncbi:MAG: hypothetical protein HZC25_09995 [Rhodospirillales bacterium]|nr:hypothetical protein [Rhodospirillales bacterium]
MSTAEPAADAAAIPRLSVVMTVRRQPEDEGAMALLAQSLATWSRLTERWPEGGEIILVDWNSDPTQPILTEALAPVVHELAPGRIRRLVVSPDLHRLLPQAEQRPIFFHVAANVGLRRARGRFVLLTQPGITPSPELADFLERGPLAAGTLYRCDSLDLASSEVRAYHGARETLDLETGATTVNALRLPSDVWLDTGLNFLRLSVAYLAESGFLFRRALQTLTEGQLVPIGARLRLGLALSSAPFRNVGLLARDSLRLWRERRMARAYFLPVHANRPHRFLLMDRQSWHDTRGLPEMPGDGRLAASTLLMGLALKGRIGEVDLASPFLTLNRQPDPPEERDTPPPAFGYLQAAGLAQALADQPGELVCNGPDWGLGGLVLPETVLGG